MSLQEPYNFSRAPFGLTEPIGRQGIENRLRFFRMGIGHPDLPQTDGDEGPVYCGSLCIPFFSQTSNIFQLENGSRSESSVALIQSWNNTRGYAFLHFCLTSRYYLAKIRAEKVPWVLLIVDHTLIEITNLVSSTFRNASGTSNYIPSDNYLLTDSHGSPHIISNDPIRPSAVSHLDCIRNSLQAFQIKLSHLICVHHGGAL